MTGHKGNRGGKSAPEKLEPAAPEEPTEESTEEPQEVRLDPPVELPKVEEPKATEQENANVRVTLPAGSRVQKFSGRGLRLHPGVNLINADKLLMVLLRRGAANGKWTLEKL